MVIDMWRYFATLSEAFDQRNRDLERENRALKEQLQAALAELDSFRACIGESGDDAHR